MPLVLHIHISATFLRLGVVGGRWVSVKAGGEAKIREPRFRYRSSSLAARDLEVPLCLLYFPYLPYLLYLLTYKFGDDVCMDSGFSKENWVL